MSNSTLALLMAVPLVASMLTACGSGDPKITKLTLSKVRAQRRAYDGAPPVIPHKPLGAACTTCHTKSGKEIPAEGFAPANPHNELDCAGAIENCRQCHVFKTSTNLFAKSDFQGLQQNLRAGDRLYPSAPPLIPHTTLMRDNCLACHSGPAVRPEIRCTHPHQINCTQCHLSTESVSSWSSKHSI